MANLENEILDEEVVVEESIDESTTEEIVVEEEQVSSTGKRKSKKQKKTLFSKIKGAFSELKKVSYPTFGKVLKQTAIVLAVTAVFTVVVFGIDQLLLLLTGLLPK